MKVIDKFLETRQQLFDAAGIKPAALTTDTKGPVKKVHYLMIGTGRPLILIHGGGSNSSEWINILKPLSQRFQLYVLDRPGSGLTDPFNYMHVDVDRHGADFIRSFMDAVQLKQTSILSQSMGAFFAINFALRYPERTDKLICIGAPAGFNHYIPAPLRLMGTPVVNRLLIRTVFKPSVENVRKLYKLLFVNSLADIPEVFFEHMRYQQLIHGWADSFFSLLENVLTWRGWKKKYFMGDKLERLSVPVYFIWGDKDVFEHPDTGKIKAKAISDYRFEVVQNAGHCPWFDNREQCIKLIKEMLDSNTVSSKHPYENRIYTI